MCLIRVGEERRGQEAEIRGHRVDFGVRIADFGFNKKAGNGTEHGAWGDNFEFRSDNEKLSF